MKRYTVYMQLAGWSGSQKFYRSYKTLQPAKNICEKLTGFGHLYIVVDNTTNEVIYRGVGQ